KQLDWIVLIIENLRLLLRGLMDRFVGGNLNWYPVEGHSEIVNAPDVFVVFGRPPGDRRSYKQWEEDDIPMTVVFEILSPGNSGTEMVKKFAFYEDFGV